MRDVLCRNSHASSSSSVRVTSASRRAFMSVNSSVFSTLKLRCVVNSWYYRMIASRLLLFQIVSHYFCQLITTPTHGHRWQPDVGLEPQLNPYLRRNLSFRATTIYTTPTSSMALLTTSSATIGNRTRNLSPFAHVILTVFDHPRNVSSAESRIVCL
jgi:hypothetical protein